MTMSITTSISKTDLQNGANGLELKSVTVVVNFSNVDNYFGGQVVLNSFEDGISLKSTTDEMIEKAISKAKDEISKSVVPTVTDPKPAPSMTLNTDSQGA